MNVLHYFLQHRSIYIHFLFSHFVSTFQNLLNVRVRYFHYIWSKKRRTVLLWTVKYKITTKITFIRWYFNVLGHGSYIRIKATPLRHFCNISDFSGFGFVFCFFVLLSVRICFVLECWCLKREGRWWWDFSFIFFVHRSEISAKEKKINKFYTSHENGQKLIFNLCT